MLGNRMVWVVQKDSKKKTLGNGLAGSQAPVNSLTGRQAAAAASIWTSSAQKDMYVTEVVAGRPSVSLSFYIDNLQKKPTTYIEG